MLKYLILACALFAAPAQAGVIDFEGLGDGAAVAPIDTGDNLVTISCGATANTGSCFSFDYGGTRTAFGPGDIPFTGFGDGTPVGFVGLSDEFTSGALVEAADFFFQFSSPITQLGLNLIDAEGPGNSFTISLFANADFTDLVGTTVFNVPNGLPDGSVVSLNAILSGTSALSAQFSDFGGDVGVAIDNLNFTTLTTAVSAPPMLGFTALALIALAVLQRRWFLSISLKGHSMFKRLILISALFALPAQAGTIDFEGLGDRAVAGTINTSDNAVTFSCGTAPNTADCFTFHYGGSITAFQPGDTPASGFGNGSSVGFVGLTDEFDINPGEPFDFFFQFANPITQLGFDLIDAESPGNNFVISLFANADFTGLIGTSTFTVPAGLPDGSVNAVNAILSSGSALSVRFADTAVDPGVAIDNLSFTTATAVSGPPTLSLAALGLFGLAGCRRRLRN